MLVRRIDGQIWMDQRGCWKFLIFLGANAKLQPNSQGHSIRVSSTSMVEELTTGAQGKERGRGYIYIYMTTEEIRDMATLQDIWTKHYYDGLYSSCIQINPIYCVDVDTIIASFIYIQRCTSHYNKCAGGVLWPVVGVQEFRRVTCHWQAWACRSSGVCIASVCGPLLYMHTCV